MPPEIEPQMPDSSDRLDVLRGQIDVIDEEIMRLVAERTAFSVAIAEEKQVRNIHTMVPGRHNEVIGNYTAAVPEDGAMTTEDAVDLAELVMRISRAAQDRHRAGARDRSNDERASLAGLAEQAAQEQGK